MNYSSNGKFLKARGGMRRLRWHREQVQIIQLFIKMKNWRNSDDIEREIKTLIAGDREDIDHAAPGIDPRLIKHPAVYWGLMILVISTPELSL